jgi:hypothetical protein
MIDKTTDPDFIQKQVNNHNAKPNSVLDNPELFDLQESVKINLKEFSFKLFGRIFRFETYSVTIKKTNNKIFDPVEVCSSSEQAAWLCKMNKERSDKMFILSIPQVINEK